MTQLFSDSSTLAGPHGFAFFCVENGDPCVRVDNHPAQVHNRRSVIGKLAKKPS